MLIDETKHRQESEARIQTNLDLISQNLKMQIVPKPNHMDEKELKSKFPLPICQREQLGVFNTFLPNNPEFKESLVSILRLPISFK